MQACPGGPKSQLCLHGMKRGNICRKARQVLPACQMLLTSGHPNTIHLAAWQSRSKWSSRVALPTGTQPHATLLRLPKDPKGLRLQSSDSNQPGRHMVAVITAPEASWPTFHGSPASCFSSLPFTLLILKME